MKMYQLNPLDNFFMLYIYWSFIQMTRGSNKIYQIDSAWKCDDTSFIAAFFRRIFKCFVFYFPLFLVV
jgi:hypothetical protein